MWARIVTFGNGMVLREPIITVDDNARRIVWSAEGGPFTHYNASLQAFAEDGATRVVWIADFLPEEVASNQQASNGCSPPSNEDNSGSTLPKIREAPSDVRCWHLADIDSDAEHVRLVGAKRTSPRSPARMSVNDPKRSSRSIVWLCRPMPGRIGQRP